MILKVIFANSVDPDFANQGPHCLLVCKNRFEKFARIFSRQYKQTIFSDAGFLDILRVKSLHMQLCSYEACFLGYPECPQRLTRLHDEQAGLRAPVA